MDYRIYGLCSLLDSIIYHYFQQEEPYARLSSYVCVKRRERKDSRYIQRELRELRSLLHPYVCYRLPGSEQWWCILSWLNTAVFPYVCLQNCQPAWRRFCGQTLSLCLWVSLAKFEINIRTFYQSRVIAMGVTGILLGTCKLQSRGLHGCEDDVNIKHNRWGVSLACLASALMVILAVVISLC
jgi:hypothetical protein